MLKKLEKHELDAFQNWKKNHIEMYDDLKKKMYCVVYEEEIDEVMTYLFLQGQKS